MAAALRRFFRSTNNRNNNNNNNHRPTPEERGGPKRYSAVRRLFGRCTTTDSPRNSRKEPAKIIPADGAQPPIIMGSTGGVVLRNGRQETTNTSNGNSAVHQKNGLMSDSVLKHNQAVRTRRLMKEYQDICRIIRNSPTKAFEVELVDDNLYEWNIRVFQFDPDSDFYRDMQDTGTQCVLLNLTFPENFPFAPPFMRVISPQIEKGFVMEGGAICMELLTPRGWASAYTIEAVIMQFSASLIRGQGRISRKYKSGKEFNRKVAENSFRSLVKTHGRYGWVTPPLNDG